MKSVTRRCSNCRRKISSEDAVIGALRAFCSYGCLKSFMASQRGQKVVEMAKLKSAKNAKQERREKLKTRSDYLKEAQAAFNRYVRLRDRDKPCISCGSFSEQKVGGTRDCGHMLSRGAHPQARFRLDNTASQCVRCNRYLSGSVANFRAGMIDRWGLERIERLESYREPVVMNIDYLKRVKDIFNRRANLYQRLFR